MPTHNIDYDRASESILGALHGLVAQSLIDKIASGDATPADLNAAIKFLKDNGINCVAERNDTMMELIDNLESYDDDVLYNASTLSTTPTLPYEQDTPPDVILRAH